MTAPRRSQGVLRVHLLAAVVVPACLALGWWQLQRALSGNTLSWAYTFEWPLFAGYALYMWWKLLHDTDEALAETAVPGPGPAAGPGRGDGGPDALGADLHPALPAARAPRAGAGQERSEVVDDTAPGTGLEARQLQGVASSPEDDELVAYNEYLAALNASGRRKRW